MIAYEELEKALARWKARRANGVEAVAEAAAEPIAEVGESTAPAPVAAAAAAGHPNPDSTGEIDLADAEVTDA